MKTKTMTWKKFQRLCICNSSKIPKLVNIDGRRMRWVGFGVVDEGPATGEEVKIIEDEA